MKKIFIAASAATLLLASVACNKTESTSTNPSSDSLSIATAVLMGSQLNQSFTMSEMQGQPIDKKEFLRGFKEYFADSAKFAYIAGAFTAIQQGKSLQEDGIAKDLFLKNLEQVLTSVDDSTKTLPMSVEDAQSFAQKFYAEKTKKENEKKFGQNKEKGAKALQEFAKDPEVTKTSTGIAYKYLSRGTGKTPQDGDNVKVSYVGKFVDGKEFDSSAEPIEFNVNGVISGWTELLKMMKVGDKIMAYIPYDMAYGESGNQGIEPFSTLVFEITLHDVVPTKK